MASQVPTADDTRFVKGARRGRRKASILDRPADVPAGAVFQPAEPEIPVGPELEPVQEPAQTVPATAIVPEAIGADLPMPNILGLDLADKPPSPAVQWSVIRVMADKLQAVILRMDNQTLEAKRVNQARWRCTATMLDGGGNAAPCDFEMFSSPPGQPKNPALICPRHGASPFMPL